MVQVRIIKIVACCCALFLAAPSIRGQALSRSTARLKLRPCTTCPPVKTLEAGQELEIVGGAGGEWLKVRVMPQGEMGWVSSKYVPIPSQLIDQLEGRSLLHQRAIQAFLWLGLAGSVISVLALFKSTRRKQGSLPATLLCDPKIVFSWFILLESGVCGIILSTTKWVGPAPASFYALIAVCFGYSVWALFWAAPTLWRFFRKATLLLITLFPPTAFSLPLLIPFALLASSAYSSLGGGIIHFCMYCRKARMAAVAQIPTDPKAVEAGRSKDMSSAAEPSDRETGKPTAKGWQLEHPEW
jgi:hypothetical protein